MKEERARPGDGSGGVSEAATAQAMTVRDLEQYVVFRLGGEMYGVPVGDVREVVPVPNLTPVPRTERFLEGIINLRGNVVPVVNLHCKMGLGEAVDLGRQSRVVVVEWGGEVVGLLVDAVVAVMPLRPERVESDQLGGEVRESVRGVARIENGRLVLLLDLIGLLDRSEG